MEHFLILNLKIFYELFIVIIVTLAINPYKMID